MNMTLKRCLLVTGLTATGNVHAELTIAAPVLVPRLKTADLKGRTLMIHVHGDHFSDKPEPLGGGGRLIGGVVP